MKKSWMILCVMSLSFLISCRSSMPPIAVCVSIPDRDGFRCYDNDGDRFFDLSYEESGGYYAVSPSDLEVIYTHCKLKDD